jgi:ComEC/Rec2-related protein
VLSLPPTAVARGAFDYRDFLRRNGVHRQLRASGPVDWQLADPESHRAPPVSDRFLDWARGILGRGFPADDPAIQLLWAMVLGWKPGLTHDMQEPFMQSGTIHVFAISGLHIALLAAILVEALRLFGLPRGPAGLAALPLVWAYTAITGWQASAIRSAVMWSVVAGGWALRRPGNLANSLALAALLLLVWDPQQLFLPGFQLSFCVVLSLALLARRFTEVLVRWTAPDPWVPPVLRSRLFGRLDRVRHLLAGSLAVSAAAWLGSMPLIAHYFHYLNPISLLANLVVVPLSSLALGSSLASLAAGAWCPGASELFNNSSWLAMKLMIRASEAAAAVPGGCFNVPAPGPVGFALYYLAGWRLLQTTPMRRTRAGALTCGALLIGLSLVLAVQVVCWSSATHLRVLPRRGGGTVWIGPAWLGSGWLLDPGDSRSVEWSLIPCLRADGINRVPHLLLTRSGVDAMGGALDLEKSLPVGERIHGVAGGRSPYLRRWIASVDRAGGVRRAVSAGASVGPWRVLHPPAGSPVIPADEVPLVLRATFSDVRVLWLPPLSLRGQDTLLTRVPPSELKADLVLAGLPTQGGGLSDPLLEAIQPSTLVVLDASVPAASRPSPQLKQRLAAWAVNGGRAVFYLEEAASLELELTGGRIRVHPWAVPRPAMPALEDTASTDPQ